MAYDIRPLEVDQYPAVFSIMYLAGEHMHRVLGLSHWANLRSSERLIEHLNDKEVFGIFDDELLIGTFNISTNPEPYYHDDMSDYWSRMDLSTMYFSAFAILPAYQQQGIGSWCMSQVDEMVQARGYPQVRFDAVNSHPKLKAFYRKNGYQEQGVLDLGSVAVMCFEKVFD